MLNKGTALAQHAVLLDNAGNLQQALPLYAHAVSLLPGAPDLRTAYGSALARSGRTPDAVRQLEHAIALDPHAPTPRIYLAAELIQQQRFPQARFQLDRALALLLALIVVLLVQSNIGGGDSAAPTLDVPGVVGLPYGQAEAALQQLGFTVSRTDADEPTEVADKVLGQQPEAGRKIPKGGLIALKVSSPTITMPNVVGQTRETATGLVAKANLAPTFVEVDSAQPPGTVLSSDPAAGAQVPKNANSTRPTVTVTLAREPAVPVPDVTAQDPFAAAATLGTATFKVTVVPTPSDTVPNGKVIGTDPAAGTPLPRGSAVKLLVSTGPAVVAVPNLVGQTRATAESVLIGLGFSVQVSFVNGGPTRTGKVVTQAPAGGQVAKGTLIAITIGL